MLQLICLFCLQNPLWPGCPLRGPKAASKAPFWAPLGLPWHAFGVTLDPWGVLFGSQWGARGTKVLRWGFQVLPKGFLMRSQGVPEGFQGAPKGSSRAPKVVVSTMVTVFPTVWGLALG